MAESSSNNAHLQEVNEEIYKRNIELAIVNKTLSLLRKLYQISLLSLDVDEVTSRISTTVREDLNLEAVSVLLFNPDLQTTEVKGFITSDRLSEYLADKQIVIPQTLRGIMDKEDFDGEEGFASSNLAKIFQLKLSPKETLEITEAGHVQSVLLYPLQTQDKFLGLLMLGMNRGYEALSTFEKDAIKNLPNVIALAVDKALIYSQLADANQKLQALDKARAEFITIASHQLRTPPSTIKWYASAIMNGDFGDLSEELRSALQRIMSSNDDQISTIDDLLNTSRIERGKLEFFFEKQPIVPLLTTIVQQMTPQAEMKGLSLIYRPSVQKFDDLTVDKEKIRQVIINVIDNAIKYTKQGSITVEILQTPEVVRIMISDTGKGVEKSEIESIFDKYTRGSESVTHANGLGLGMYVAKMIMGQHKGKIWAESEGSGKGSRFIIEIPKHVELKNQVVDLTQTV